MIHPLHGHYTAGGLLAFLVAVCVLPLVWWALNRLSPWDDNQEMFEKNNTGFTIIRGFQIIALAYALAPVIGYSTPHWWQHLLWALFDAIWACALLAIAAVIINRVVCHAHGGLNAIRHNSSAAAVVIGVFWVAYGLIIGATLPGPGSGVAHTLAISLAFSLMGLAYVTLVYVIAAKTRLFRKVASSDSSGINTEHKVTLGDLVRQGNWAAATLASTMVYTLGVVTSSAVAGAFTSWSDSIVTFLVAAVILLALSAGSLLLVDRLVVRSETVKSTVEKNLVRPAGIMCAFWIGLAICASYVVS